MLTNIITTALAVRSTAVVCRELGIPAWFLERVLREEAMTIARVGSARAWTDEDVRRLRDALGARAARRAARRRATRSLSTQRLDPDDAAQDLAAEFAHEDEERAAETTPGTARS